MFIGIITIGLASSQLPACDPTAIYARPYPGNCQRFIRCVMGNQIIQDCAPGLAFDEVVGFCNVMDAVVCEITTTTTTTTAAPFPCPPTGVHRFADPDNCLRFIQCVVGNVIIQNCAPGMAFDENLGTCNLQEFTSCSMTSTQPPATTTTTTTPAPACPTLKVEAIAYPGHCNRYILCSNPIVLECPPGHGFDEVLGQCKAVENCLPSGKTGPYDTISQL